MIAVENTTKEKCGLVHISLRHKNVTSAIMSLIQKIKQEAINVGFIEKDATLIQLATEEACMNAYEYCHSAEVDNFTVTYLFSHQQCIIDIFHRGEIFEVRYTNEINYGLRGRGLQLITSIMDEVNVEQKGKNVHLVMVKKVQ